MVEVVFIKDVPGQARKGDVKQVADGYARNFLFARGLAVKSNKKLVEELEAERERKAATAEAKRGEYQELVAKLKDAELKIGAKANDKGKLFSAVSVEEILTAIKEQLKIDLGIEQIRIDNPLKEVGEHAVGVMFLPDLSTTIKVKVHGEK